MIAFEQIKDFSDKVANQFQPERITLFGSYAYGTPTEDSDVDLLVVMPYEGRRAQTATEIRLAIQAGFPLDLIPITPTRLQERLELGDCFLREIMERGVVLHAANHTGMG